MFFCVAGLDVLNIVDEIPQERKNEMIEWLYSLQVESETGKYC